MYNKILIKKKKYCFELNKNIDNLNFSDTKFIKEKFLNKKDYFLIIKNFGKTSKEIKDNIINFSQKFGKIISQDKYDKKFVEITPDIKKINKNKPKNKIKLRYHQTNSGGYIHSDGPQLSRPPKFVLMGCIKQASKGGYSILSSIDKIINELKKKDKKILSTLKKKFLFERRGFYFENQKKILKKPVIETYNKEIKFRYLRSYMEEAYRISSKDMPASQVNAINKLDKLLSKKKNQYKFKLNAGDMLLINNHRLAHGRSAFDLTNNNNRSLIRVWFK